MNDPFLILHKVRGEPAFDIAIQIPCPLCHQGEYPMCVECDESGLWWIIPTSGHRAHPYQHWRLEDIFDVPHEGDLAWNYAMPDPWPDHYPSRTAPAIDISSVITALAKPSEPVERRF